MTAGVSTTPMFCARCNTARSEGDTCEKCGRKLSPLAGHQRRGWVAFGAGIFLIVFMSAVWIWLDGLFSSGSMRADPAEIAALEGKLNVAFGLIVVSGILGTINGWGMAHTGRRNLFLLVALILVFAAALFLVYGATSSFQGG